MTKRHSDPDRPAKADRQGEHRVARHAAKVALRGHGIRLTTFSWSAPPDLRRSTFAAMPDVGVDPDDFVRGLVSDDVQQYEDRRVDDDLEDIQDAFLARFDYED